MIPTYIVTGRHRSGTSMMMRAIHKSSNLTPEYDYSQDVMMRRTHANPDYHPNPNGYYLPRFHITAHDVPGGLIKVSTRNPWEWEGLHPGNYFVCQMTRLDRERLASWEAAFGYPDDKYNDQYAASEAIIATRPDLHVTTISYHDVINNPLAVFTRLADAGWPIDPALAITFIDHSLYRTKG